MQPERPTQVTCVVSRRGREVRLLLGLGLDAALPSGERITARMEQPIFRVGSHESNDLVLPDPAISKHHLELHATPDGYRVVDLSSSNGTWLDGARLGAVTISDAVTLQLGRTRLQLIPDGAEVEVPASPEETFGALVGRSVVMRELFLRLGQVAASDCLVVLEGETGTGKDAMARAVHDASERAANPFVVLECAGLHPDLIDDQLFGHVRGAFTGADEDRAGLIESASGGTLYLDEVADLPLTLQSKLLGVLERRRVKRLGSEAARPVDVRVIAGTQRNLAREVNLGRFRPDLFYRLSVVRLRVPSLRERLEDLPLLAARFLEAARARGIADVPSSLSTLALTRLRAQPWTGNVRELKNVIDRMLERLPGDDLAAEADSEMAPSTGGGTFFSAREAALAQFERAYFSDQLARHAGNLSAVARATQLDRRYLQRILKRLGLYSAKDDADADDPAADDA